MQLTRFIQANLLGTLGSRLWQRTRRIGSSWTDHKLLTSAAGLGRSGLMRMMGSSGSLAHRNIVI